MEIIAGNCKVILGGSEESDSYSENQSFNVPENSSFTIEVNDGTCEYICSFID
jgi:uncharacterized protein YaiE (UPF0345 family)